MLSPVIAHLGAGILPVEVFQAFVEADVYYLSAIAKVTAGPTSLVELPFNWAAQRDPSSAGMQMQTCLSLFLTRRWARRFPSHPTPRFYALLRRSSKGAQRSRRHSVHPFWEQHLCRQSAGVAAARPPTHCARCGAAACSLTNELQLYSLEAASLAGAKWQNYAPADPPSSTITAASFLQGALPICISLFVSAPRLSAPLPMMPPSAPARPHFPRLFLPTETAANQGPAAILAAIVPFLRLRSLIAGAIDGARASAHSCRPSWRVGGARRLL